MIEIENVSMSYGSLLVVDKLTLKVEPGEIYAFLGPNAAGKTTTIKLMTGLLKPITGVIKICGIDIEKEPVKAKSNIGFIPDVAVFYEKLTPLEFMSFIANLFSIDRSYAYKLSHELFDTFHLNEFKNELIENLSHGTRQRLAFASALLHNPKVLIIDEPMVGLDPLHTHIIKNSLVEISKSGTTVFMSTHLLNIAQELAHKVGIINRGKLLIEGTVDELRNKLSSDKFGDEKSDSEYTELEKVFLRLVKNSEIKSKQVQNSIES